MFNDTILQLWGNPYHRGLPHDAETMSLFIGQEGFPGEGPYMKVALQWQDGRFLDAWFETYPCPGAISCGSWLCSWLKGKEYDQAINLTRDDLLRVLGGLPIGKEHCADLAIAALKSTLVQVHEVAPKTLKI